MSMVINEVKKIISFINKTFQREGFNKALVAVSGGIDSSVVLDLTVRALGVENVYSLQLPYKNQDVKNSDLIIKWVKIPERNRININIEKTVDSFEVTEKRRLGNIMARVRMIYTFDQARKLTSLVMGTENKSERELGYYTRFGDEASDIEPIIHLYKTQVKQLAQELNIPEKIIKQVPTAGLWQGQTDEGDFGFSYKKAEEYFKNKKKNERVEKWLRAVDFKKRVPYTL